jgi:hypothetical protein
VSAYIHKNMCARALAQSHGKSVALSVVARAHVWRCVHGGLAARSAPPAGARTHVHHARPLPARARAPPC